MGGVKIKETQILFSNERREMIGQYANNKNVCPFKKLSMFFEIVACFKISVKTPTLPQLSTSVCMCLAMLKMYLFTQQSPG